MSALPRNIDPSEFGYHGLRMGATDFFGLEPTRERYELIHGVVCMSPRPSTLHQRLLSLIQYQLELFVRANPGHRYFAEVDLEVDATTVYAPDVVCFRPGRVAGFPARLEAAPDLVIEVLSSGTKAFDLTTKRDDYERCGVGEYWIIDPLKFRFRAYRREGRQLVETPVTGDSVASASVPGFVLDLQPLRSVCDGSQA